MYAISAQACMPKMDECMPRSAMTEAWGMLASIAAALAAPAASSAAAATAASVVAAGATSISRARPSDSAACGRSKEQPAVHSEWHVGCSTGPQVMHGEF